jgi:hypothetical protein
MATKEFLRKLRQKHHLGEFSKKHLKKDFATIATHKVSRKAKRRYFLRQARGVSKMVHHRKTHSSKGGGVMSLVRMAYSAGMTGVGSATVANQLTGGKEVIPFQAEVAAFGGAALTGKSLKNAVIKGAIGAGVTAGLKYLPSMVKGIGGNASPNGANMN